jgi:hypothetical protein
MKTTQLIALADLAKSGVFSETQIEVMIQAAFGQSQVTPNKAAQRFVESPVLLLGYAENIHKAVREKHPRYKKPTWEHAGEVYTSLYGFIDAIEYRSCSGVDRFISELNRVGALKHTVNHMAPSDSGMFKLPKFSGSETKYASLKDLTAAAFAIFTRSHQKLKRLGAVEQAASVTYLRAA